MLKFFGKKFFEMLKLKEFHSMSEIENFSIWLLEGNKIDNHIDI